LLYSQLAYGLRIAANHVIPGLVPYEKSAVSDIAIHLNDGTEVPELPSCELLYTSEGMNRSDEPALRLARSPSGAYVFFYGDGVRFAVDPKGHEIVASWRLGYSLEDAATYLVGPILAFVLRLHGSVCLHASAVAIEGRAIALVGSPGAGKSSAAAAFAKSGYSVMSDDVVALVEQKDCFRVEPGYPRVNLWPDAARALFGSEDALPRGTPTWDKRFLALDQDRFRFEPQALPLGVVYVLRTRDAGRSACRIDPVLPPSAIVTLVANTYLNYLLDKNMRSKEFAVLGRLVNSIAVRIVDSPDATSQLGELAEAIAADAKEVFAARSGLPVNSY